VNLPANWVTGVLILLALLAWLVVYLFT